MPLFFLIGIYILFWTFTLFLVLPFFIRSNHEAGENEVPGHAYGAPHRPRILQRLMWTTIVSLIFFGIFMLNVWQGWLTLADIDSWLPHQLD